MRLIPATLEMLGYTGILAFPEAMEFLDLWGGGSYAVLDDGEPFAIIAIKDHPEDSRYCWGNAWVIPERRGRWLSAEARVLVEGFVLMRHEKVLAATDNSRCGRFLRRRGFKMYCQAAGVSYYSLTREVL